MMKIILFLLLAIPTLSFSQPLQKTDEVRSTDCEAVTPDRIGQKCVETDNATDTLWIATIAAAGGFSAINSGAGVSSAAKYSVTGSSDTPPDSNTLYKENIVKGWINFDGVTFGQRGSFNVSSIADNDTGDYTITWDTDFSDANYAVAALAGEFGVKWGRPQHPAGGGYATGTFNIVNTTNAGAAEDTAYFSVIAIGSQ
jgi:hypothetical protein